MVTLYVNLYWSARLIKSCEVEQKISGNESETMNPINKTSILAINHKFEFVK